MRKLGSMIGPSVLAVALTIAATAMMAPPVHAQDADSPPPPEPHIQPLELAFSETGLSGPGADMLRTDMQNAQFIFIGEDHGFAAAPALVAAMATEAKPLGFSHYAIEVGPYSADWLRDTLLQGGPDALAQGLSGRPLAVPFLSLREEAETAMMFLGEDQLWGIDQEFIGSPLIHLEWLADRAGPGDSKVRALFEAEKEAFATGNQPAVLMATADAALWDEMRETFADDPEAVGLLDELERSQAIYMANFAGRGFDNNLDRVAVIREYFMRQYLAAEEASGTPPKVISKLGAVHAGAATSPMKTFDIGSLVEGIAAANDMNALRIAYFPVGGEQLAIRPSPDGAFSVKPVQRGDRLITALRGAGVDMSMVENNDGHYLIAMEPVRRAMRNKGLNEADDMFRFVVLGFDYLVTTSAATAGTPLANQ